MAQRSNSHSGSDRPLARTDEPEWTSPALVWWAVLDERYLVEVVRVSGSDDRALLRVFDSANEDRQLMREEILLAAGARFGPDIADVAAWQEAAMTLVDGRSRTEP